MGEDIGIDLGTTSILIYVKGKGIVLREPSVIAVDKRTNEVIAIGKEAQNMIGRVSDNIDVVKPLKDGVISNFTLAGKMLKYYIKKACKKKPGQVLICVPSQITDVEKRAVIDVALDTGAKKVKLIDEPVAAAIGAGIDIDKPSGNMVIDIGGGTTDIAVISIGNSVVGKSINIAGNKFDSTIKNYLKKQFKILVGDRTAEEIKIKIGGVIPSLENNSMIVRGRNAENGLPMQIEITSRDLIVPLRNDAIKIVHAIMVLLEESPPELVQDISTKRIYITGGGSLIYGLDKLISECTSLNVMVADDAISCVAIGIGKSISNANKEKNNIKKQIQNNKKKQ